ncbi:hypothetical protein Kpol_1018p14 [Vanderwaltozyma polyspora DSM 70294]|uniref:Mediator of RNA polymerase II transcription subunit 9 n=1 Tax=Vanderwaltozyma polyspora (strain ATCC 22028 / DSM 70294 / BCRC 21397 / CBS 2163 / NBRC 10782 / NRRL Y-8283 / UCD 57-17) TaxID=436907 RepID=A7TDL6_VANPO|nr:uncharacterized protein Kpol_1018p14 [Vanderwaltozyma polyspora DSM 70294]EDO19486.1 hypothetical protein Kpol_1018p14 [Vanderwaltozyma polyspora DSM 70294]
MVLENECLRKIQETLAPVSKSQAQEQIQVKDELQPQGLSPPQSITRSSSMATTNTAITTNSSEFIPHIFYSMYQIKKDPNNSSNQLETSTGFIKHRLKSCKTLIESDEDCRKLLSKSTDEWDDYIKQRELEIEGKRNVLKSLNNKIGELLTE